MGRKMLSMVQKAQFLQSGNNQACGQGVNMETCLVCGKERVSNESVRCKLCGMKTKEEHASKSHDFVFCCAECMKRFSIILEKSSDGEKENLLRKKIVI